MNGERFSFILEAYSLGQVTREHQRQQNRKRNELIMQDVYLFYTRTQHPFSIDKLIEETAGLTFPRLLHYGAFKKSIPEQTLLGPTQGEDARNHTIIKYTGPHNFTKREMIYHPGTPGPASERKLFDYDLKLWDPDLIEKCRKLPDHVKNTIGI